MKLLFTHSRKNLEDKVLRYLGRPDYTPLNLPGLAQALKLEGREHSSLEATLGILEEAGRVVRIRKDHWILPDEANLITGVVMFNPKGHAVLIPNDPEVKKFQIAAEDTNLALHQDLVVARRLTRPKRAFHGRPGSQPPLESAQIIRILKRRRENYVGTLQQDGRFFQVIPDDPRYVQNFYVPHPSESRCTPKPVAGDKVVVRITRWESRQACPEAEIVERLGRPGDPGVDILAIIRKHNLRTEFSTEALAEVGDFAHPDGDAPFDPKDKKRIDLRQEFIITIDPDTARDFDDAIHVTPLGNNRWEIGVHIADVSHYVQHGTALDREARRRGNSIYLVNQVIPMLPEELSNGLCSLNPHVDRLTFSVIAVVDEEGRIQSHRITPSVIHSKHRLTYEQAMERLKARPENDLDDLLHRAWDVASKLRRKRFREGALDLEMPDVKVVLNDQGEPVDIIKQEYDESHQLIEEFMLMANEVVALELRNKQWPAVFRVHEAPDPEKLQDYRETLSAHGIKVGDLTQMKEVRRALEKISERPDGHALKVAFLRSLKKADYRTKPLGHYGLAKVNYTHFTSPIRRYADLIVHRSLRERRRLMSPEQLSEVALHISETERIAADAEMESVKLKKLEFFARQMNVEPPPRFKALIMEVTNYGLFVELPDSLMSGLIHVSSIEGDFFHFSEMDQTLTGKRNKIQYRMGDTIEVVVDRVDIMRQMVDFRMAGTSPRRGRDGSGKTSFAPRSESRRPESNRRSGGGSSSFSSKKKNFHPASAPQESAEGSTEKKKRRRRPRRKK
ncbi:MAG: ribonuclease R [Candidatus Methylacidiphilales bacterium]